MNSRKIAFLILLVSAMGLNSCGSSPSSTYSLNGIGYSVVTAGTLLHNGTSVSGTGAIVFSAPLSETRSNNGFLLTFTLDDGGKLELVSNATAQLTSGVTVRVVRSGAAVTITTLIGDASTSFSAPFNSGSVDATGSITLQIDVHNFESPAHILAWDSTVTAPFDEDNALFSSNATAGVGAGSFWGLVLENAVVSAASTLDARFSD